MFWTILWLLRDFISHFHIKNSSKCDLGCLTVAQTTPNGLNSPIFRSDMSRSSKLQNSLPLVELSACSFVYLCPQQRCVQRLPSPNCLEAGRGVPSLVLLLSKVATVWQTSFFVLNTGQQFIELTFVTIVLGLGTVRGSSRTQYQGNVELLYSIGLFLILTVFGLRFCLAGLLKPLLDL